MTTDTYKQDENTTMLAGVILPIEDSSSTLAPMRDSDKFTLFVFKLKRSAGTSAYEVYLKADTGAFKHLVPSSVNNGDMKALAAFITDTINLLYKSLDSEGRATIIHQAYSTCEKLIIESAISAVNQGDAKYGHYFIRFNGASSFTPETIDHRVTAALYDNQRMITKLASGDLKAVLNEHEDVIIEGGAYTEFVERVIVRDEPIEDAGNGNSDNSNVSINLDENKDNLTAGYEGMTTADRFRALLNKTSTDGKSLFGEEGIRAYC